MVVRVKKIAVHTIGVIIAVVFAVIASLGWLAIMFYLTAVLKNVGV